MAKQKADPEGVGEAFTVAGMLAARDQTRAAVRRISDKLEIGMTGLQAIELAEQELQAMGMDRQWHAPLIRFGQDTLKSFRNPVDKDSMLQDDDIYFVDLGVVWDGLEGDAGETFVIGGDDEKGACAQAVRDIWQAVAHHWKTTRAAGAALYSFADEEARRRGWKFNHDILGHRLSEFPHSIYKAGWLSEFEKAPAAGLWILEIQIAHLHKPYGAFYEDLLIDETFCM